MLPWKLLDTAKVPQGEEELRLHQRGTEYSIRVGGYELMNSRVHASEDALAEVVCERMQERDGARVLIGGLGMGYTLAGMLKRLGPTASVIIAELVPQVIAWNRGPLAALAGHPRDDPRVSVREGDVAKVIAGERNALDAIVLDVDNGPAALTTKSNDRLYSLVGLRKAHNALRPSGILAVWSGGPDPRFHRRLQDAGFTAEEIRVRARGTKGGARVVIWVAGRGA